MLEGVLEKSDCATCKRCCRFDPDELVDAPCFTPESWAIARKINPGAGSTKRGALTQVVLDKIPGAEKYVCPFLDDRTGCSLGELRPFDCKTYPFFAMRHGGKVVMAISRDCPVLRGKNLDELLGYVRTSRLDEYMERVISKYPDLVTDFHGNMEILCELNKDSNEAS